MLGKIHSGPGAKTQISTLVVLTTTASVSSHSLIFTTTALAPWLLHFLCTNICQYGSLTLVEGRTSFRKGMARIKTNPFRHWGGVKFG